jgi:uncharacterized protein (TIGR03118 family)
MNGFAESALVANNTGVVATTTKADPTAYGQVTRRVAPFGLPTATATCYRTMAQAKFRRTQSPVRALSDLHSPSAAGVPANPTGQVHNGNGGFLISTIKGQETALFIFAGEGGTIAAWAKDSGATAVTLYDDGVDYGTRHAVYKGLALGTVNRASFLYATDLHNNKIDVFDTNFGKPQDMQAKFLDPTMPAGFVPFGIVALNNQLYVTYAKRDAAMHGETTGAGLGYVNVFDFSGNFISRFASAGPLNAPGIALAPAGLGSLAGDLLIGNFGDGTINIFPPNGTSLASSMGPLTLNNGAVFAVPGLWSLVFGDGDSDKPLTTLFYTAGFANQTDGVFGSIAVSNVPTTNPY